MRLLMAPPLVLIGDRFPRLFVLRFVHLKDSSDQDVFTAVFQFGRSCSVSIDLIGGIDLHVKHNAIVLWFAMPDSLQTLVCDGSLITSSFNMVFGSSPFGKEFYLLGRFFDRRFSSRGLIVADRIARSWFQQKQLIGFSTDAAFDSRSLAHWFRLHLGIWIAESGS